MKIHVSFRLSEDALLALKALSKAKGVSQAAILELVLRDEAKREKVVVPKK